MSRSFISLIVLVIATILLLFWHAIGLQILHLFSISYTFFMHLFQPIIADHKVRQIVVLLLVPSLLGLIPVFFYWVFSRRWLYEYMTFVWCIWLVLITMIIIKQGYHV